MEAEYRNISIKILESENKAELPGTIEENPISDTINRIEKERRRQIKRKPS
jgi:hypothetical protein